MIGHISIFRALSTLIAFGTIGACLAEPGGLSTGAGGSSGTGMVACGGSTGASALATWANVRSIIEGDPVGGCYGADCHRQGEREPIMLGSSAPLSDAALYDKLTTYKTTKCGNRVLVKPCAPNESSFYLAQTGMCGDLAQMPFGCLPEFDNCTAADKLEGLREWIASGAPRP